MPKPTCKKNHRYDDTFSELPTDQGGDGRHVCAGCAYEAGKVSGAKREESMILAFNALPTSQAGAVRHKSPHAAWALGYLHGVQESYGVATT